jgi:hypothetical protein
MTKDIHDKLKEFEEIFKYAIKMDFLRITPDVFKAIMEIYKEHFGKTLNKTQMSCNSCKLKAIKELGKEYFAYVEEVVEEEKHKTKRRGRPKKIDIE